MFGVLAAIAIINIMAYYRKKLYVSILIGIILVAVFNAFSGTKTANIFFTALTSPVTITLVLIIINITAFSNLIKETGNLNNMVEKLALFLRDRRYQVVVLPAIIGLLAFPGGAVFSAPLVEEAGISLEMDRTNLSLGNIIFRHFYYPIYPFHPGLIFVATISGIDILHFIKFNLLVIAISFYCACFCIFRKAKTGNKNQINLQDLPALIYSFSPLLIIVSFAMVLKVYFPWAIIMGILWALFIYPSKELTLLDSLKQRFVALVKGINWSMALTVALVVVFKDFLDESGAVRQVAAALVDKGFPLIILTTVIPYFVGIVTGSDTASLGITIPMFLVSLPESELKGHYLFIVFLSAFAGYLGSPLHMCTVLTNEYNQANTWQVIKRINIFGLSLIVCGLIMFLLAHKLF